jgi:hypothetical protein
VFCHQKKAKEKQEGLDCKTTAYTLTASNPEPAAPKAVELGKPIEFVPSTQAEDEEFRKYHL